MSLAWLASVREDVGLFANEYLPELLLVGALTLLVWGIRNRFARDHRPSC